MYSSRRKYETFLQQLQGLDYGTETLLVLVLLVVVH
jgi:hypothetical protein